jgi:hypothetical protein
MVLFMDWSFASGCSPPRLSTTQLPSATDRPVLLSDEDFHLTVGAYFQAHILSALRASSLLLSETDSKIRQAPGLSSCIAFGVYSSQCRPSRRYFWRVICDRLKGLREHNRLYLGSSCFTLRI